MTERGRLLAKIRRGRAAAEVLAGELAQADSAMVPRRTLRAATTALATQESRLEELRRQLDEEGLALERERADLYAEGWTQGWAAARRQHHK